MEIRNLNSIYSIVKRINKRISFFFNYYYYNQYFIALFVSQFFKELRMWDSHGKLLHMVAFWGLIHLGLSRCELKTESSLMNPFGPRNAMCAQKLAHLRWASYYTHPGYFGLSLHNLFLRPIYFFCFQ